MKIRPIHDRILVTRVEAQEVGRGGIIIPDTAKEKPQEGKVVAVGNGKVNEDGKRIPMESNAWRVEGFLRYSFENSGKNLPSRFDIGARVGFSFWR